MHNLIGEWRALWHARALVWVLARRDIAARYAGSAGGVVWAYAQPLLTIAAYFLVFDVVFSMRLGEHAPTDRVGTYLIAGMLPWMAFCEATTRGMNSLVESGGLLQKNALLPVLFPARAVLASTLVFAPLLLALVPAFMTHHHFSPALLAFPLVLLLQVGMSLILAHMLAIFAAALRDTIHLVGFVLSVGVFVSPILFPITLFPEGWRWVLWANPMTPWVTSYQTVLLQGGWPDPKAWLAMLFWMLAFSVVLSVLLRRSRDQLVDWL